MSAPVGPLKAGLRSGRAQAALRQGAARAGLSWAGPRAREPRGPVSVPALLFSKDHLLSQTQNITSGIPAGFAQQTPVLRVRVHVRGWGDGCHHVWLQG